LFAQERTVNLGLVDLTTTKNVAYNGGTNDRLIPTTRDTIDYYVQLSNYTAGHPLHFYCVFTFDTIAGIDTTIAITVQEKKFASESYTDVIASATTGVIRNDTSVVKTSLGLSEFTETTASAVDFLQQTTIANKDTLTVAARSLTRVSNTLLYYKYLKFRLILQGNDSVGTGIRIKRVELQFF
jgi:hypothetical protein